MIAARLQGRWRHLVADRTNRPVQRATPPEILDPEECPLLAQSGHSAGKAGMTALERKADIASSRFAFRRCGANPLRTKAARSLSLAARAAAKATWPGSSGRYLQASMPFPDPLLPHAGCPARDGGALMFSPLTGEPIGGLLLISAKLENFFCRWPARCPLGHAGRQDPPAPLLVRRATCRRQDARRYFAGLDFAARSALV